MTSHHPDLANHNPNLTDRAAGRRNVIKMDRHVAAVKEAVRRLRAAEASTQTTLSMGERTGDEDNSR